MVRNTYIYPELPSMRIISTSSPTPRQHAGSTRSRSPATTCRRPGRPPTSRWPTRWPTAWSTSAPARAGLDVDAFAPRLSFFWAIGMNFFMEVAKMRAARLLWSELVKDSSTRRTRSRWSLRTHSQTSAGRLTAQDVFNNVIRTCVEAMARRRPHTSRCTPTRWTRRSRCRPTSPPASPATPSCSCSRSRHHPGHRPVGRFVLRRAAHPPAGRAGVDAHHRGRGAGGRHGQAIEAGIPKLRIEEAAARTQARIDSGGRR